MCDFAVDISSFHIQEQKDLHSCHMVQGFRIFSCMFWSHFLYLLKYYLIFWEY